MKNRRKNKRGAAMVETIIVISTQLIFMGLIIWMRNAYGAKIDMQQTTRSDVAYYTAHACDEQGGGGANRAATGTVPSGPEGNPANTGARRSNLPDAPAVNKDWNSADLSMATTINGQAVWDRNASRGGGINYGKMPLASSVSAKSVGTCNEKKYTSQLTAWFQFGVNMATSGGGFADLFNGN